MKERIVSGLIIMTIMILMVIGGVGWVAAGVYIAWGIGLLEFNRLVARQGHRAHGGLMLLWMALFIADRLWPDAGLFAPGVAGLMLVTLIWSEIRFRQGTANAITGFAMTLAGSFYIGWVGAHFVSIRALEDGIFWVFTVAVATMAADTMAYLIGRSIGRTPLIPDISPKKTWEGYIGGIVFSILFSGLSVVAWQQLGAGPSVKVIHGLIIGALISVIGPIGDLGISVLKRHAHAKNSSNLIPGHGGFLDRIDVFSIAGLLGYYYLTLFAL